MSVTAFSWMYGFVTALFVVMFLDYLGSTIESGLLNLLALGMIVIIMAFMNFLAGDVDGE